MITEKVLRKTEILVEKMLCENCPDVDTSEFCCDYCQMFYNFRDMLLKDTGELVEDCEEK